MTEDGARIQADVTTAAGELRLRLHLRSEIKDGDIGWQQCHSLPGLAATRRRLVERSAGSLEVMRRAAKRGDPVSKTSMKPSIAVSVLHALSR